jgi:hypothetical protein
LPVDAGLKLPQVPAGEQLHVTPEESWETLALRFTVWLGRIAGGGGISYDTCEAETVIVMVELALFELSATDLAETVTWPLLGTTAGAV